MLQSVLQSRTFGSAAQHAGDSAASEPHVYEVHRPQLFGRHWSGRCFRTVALLCRKVRLIGRPLMRPLDCRN